MVTVTTITRALCSTPTCNRQEKFNGHLDESVTAFVKIGWRFNNAQFGDTCPSCNEVLFANSKEQSVDELRRLLSLPRE